LKKKKNKKRKSEEPETPPVEAPKPKKPQPVDEKHKLYIKATLTGALGQKGESIEAHNIPNGVLLHLVKNGKYVKTMIYYERFWFPYTTK